MISQPKVNSRKQLSTYGIIQACDLWNVYVAYGNIIDVFNPFKKSNAGFQREPRNNVPQTNVYHPKNNVSVGAIKNLLAAVLKSRKVNPNIADESYPAIVLNDSCLMEHDFSYSLIGKIKYINALSNLCFILANEGFGNVKLSYLGGIWILIDIDSIASKEKISNHVGVGLWFNELKPALSPWGELTDLEDYESISLSYKRLCVKTKPNVIINDKIKEDDSSSDDESEGDHEENKSGNNRNDFELDKENENKETVEVEGEDPQFPPSSTPNVPKENVVKNNSEKITQPKTTMFDNNEGVSTDKSGCNHGSKFKVSGTILEVMDELIKVGKTMDYNMDECMKNIEAIIGLQGDRPRIMKRTKCAMTFNLKKVEVEGEDPQFPPSSTPNVPEENIVKNNLEKIPQPKTTMFDNNEGVSTDKSGCNHGSKFKDHGVNPPHIDECCYECGNALDGIFCQQCTCKSCGKGAHTGYNSPPKVPIISNPEPCNQTINNELPQTLPSFDSMCYSDKENLVPCVSKPNLVDESSNIFNPPPQPPIYSCEFCESNAQYGHYCTPQALFINLEPGYSQDLNFPQNIHDFQQQYLCCDQCGGPHETFQCQQNDLLSSRTTPMEQMTQLTSMCEMICQIFQKKQEEKRIKEEQAAKARYWKIPACCDDDDDYNSAITPVLSTKEPDNSLSESEGIPDTMCDVYFVNNPTPLEAKDHFEIVINSNDDISSCDYDSLYNENIEYVEASTHDSELVSLEAAEIVIPEVEEIKDDNLSEKLLNVHLLIANIEALKDNPTPSFKSLTKSSSTSPKSFLEETNTFHNSLPEFENFYFDLEEISSGSTTTHSDISLPDYEFFYFNDDHIEEISGGSTTIHSDISL
nr:hypothetical protein [Tanacetum cinerariifolium]